MLRPLGHLTLVSDKKISPKWCTISIPHRISSTLELVDTKNYCSTIWIGFSFHFEVKLWSTSMRRNFTETRQPANAEEDCIHNLGHSVEWTQSAHGWLVFRNEKMNWIVRNYVKMHTHQILTKIARLLKVHKTQYHMSVQHVKKIQSWSNGH